MNDEMIRKELFKLEIKLANDFNYKLVLLTKRVSDLESTLLTNTIMNLKENGELDGDSVYDSEETKGAGYFKED
jgi:hypothetical protein